MASITVNINAINSIRGNLNDVATGGIRAGTGVRQVQSRLDRKIANRRSISYRLNRLEDDIASILTRINNFGSFVDRSMDTYANAEISIVKKAIDLGILDGSALNSVKYERQVQEKPKEKGTSNDDKANNVTVTNTSVTENKTGKESYSLIDNIFNSDGKYYQGMQVGKAILGIGLGILAVAGASTAGAPFLVGLALVYGVNSIVSSACDLVNASNRNYGSVGKVNYLKDGLKGVFGFIGKQFHQEEFGKRVGESIYHVGNIVNITAGAVKSIKEVANLSKNFGSKVKDAPRVLRNSYNNIVRKTHRIPNANLDIINKAKKGAHIINLEIQRVKRLAPIVFDSPKIVAEASKSAISILYKLPMANIDLYKGIIGKSEKELAYD